MVHPLEIVLPQQESFSEAILYKLCQSEWHYLSLAHTASSCRCLYSLWKWAPAANWKHWEMKSARQTQREKEFKKQFKHSLNKQPNHTETDPNHYGDPSHNKENVYCACVCLLKKQSTKSSGTMILPRQRLFWDNVKAYCFH